MVNVVEEVRNAHAPGARERMDALCCPVRYDPQHLEVIGDPYGHLRSDEIAANSRLGHREDLLQRGAVGRARLRALQEMNGERSEARDSKAGCC